MAGPPIGSRHWRTVVSQPSERRQCDGYSARPSQAKLSSVERCCDAARAEIKPRRESRVPATARAFAPVELRLEAAFGDERDSIFADLRGQIVIAGDRTLINWRSTLPRRGPGIVNNVGEPKACFVVATTKVFDILCRAFLSALSERTESFAR
jgi:hypothetical protein